MAELILGKNKGKKIKENNNSKMSENIKSFNEEKSKK